MYYVDFEIMKNGTLPITAKRIGKYDYGVCGFVRLLEREVIRKVIPGGRSIFFRESSFATKSLDF